MKLDWADADIKVEFLQSKQWITLTGTAGLKSARGVSLKSTGSKIRLTSTELSRTRISAITVDLRAPSPLIGIQAYSGPQVVAEKMIAGEAQSITDVNIESETITGIQIEGGDVALIDLCVGLPLRTSRSAGTLSPVR
jgi:hypothetical protein